MKNPANAARIKYLLDMYPNAKFIYSYRNPYTLFCSMKLLFRKLMELSTLQTWDDEKFVMQFVNMFSRCYSEFERTKSLIPPENFYTLKYEDFIKNPIKYLEEIYNKFGLDDFEEVKTIIQKYTSEKSDFKVNKHTLTPKIIQLVNSEWDEYRKKHGYERFEPS
jgi:hypothetical protein